MGTTQRRSIGLTYNCVRINTFAPYFLQMLFWVEVNISSQSLFDNSLLFTFGRHLEDDGMKTDSTSWFAIALTA